MSEKQHEAAEDRLYHLLRVETIHYHVEYTRAELVEADILPESDEDYAQDLKDLAAAVENDDYFRAQLEEDTERTADVQGNRFLWSARP